MVTTIKIAGAEDKQIRVRPPSLSIQDDVLDLGHIQNINLMLFDSHAHQQLNRNLHSRFLSRLLSRRTSGSLWLRK
ncbi:hypothetical protein M378DRAFT_948947 [Amanita muscaria Koide BX008]|uniref:Uncharacterized protein n=1 Tax=Amanita muscaria (strain Koide BX008) TaxID=946122 RepID=A0A0C2T1D1_AMAMK|nr:hypothetical protein M378DRAFT_948947 [Amanita muscaria Koide BX008]